MRKIYGYAEHECVNIPAFSWNDGEIIFANLVVWKYCSFRSCALYKRGRSKEKKLSMRLFAIISQLAFVIRVSTEIISHHTRESKTMNPIFNFCLQHAQCSVILTFYIYIWNTHLYIERASQQEVVTTGTSYIAPKQFTVRNI